MKQAKKPLVYVVPDIERALGREPGGDYFVITNRTPYAESVAKKYPDNVYLIDGAYATSELLALPEVIKNIHLHDADVMVFIGNATAERAANAHGLRLIHPKAKLASQIEGKISQIEWLGPLASLLPKYKVGPLKNFHYDGYPLILQFGFSHTGEGTHLIDSEEKLARFQDKFPKRLARTLRYIDGEVFTVNAVVAGDTTLVGNISFQITGLAPFADLPYSTVGNDWALPQKILSPGQLTEIRSMAESVGKRLGEAGWRGLFGIDVICETKTGKIYLIEINARQPASTTLESQLQKKAGDGLTVFDAHIRALRGEKNVGTLQDIHDGAQIVQRVTKSRNKKTLHVDTDMIEMAGFGVIRYENDEPNSDLVRITSSTGIMSSPTTLNTHGKTISSSLS
jgi:hypothetical protein